MNVNRITQLFILLTGIILLSFSCPTGYTQGDDGREEPSTTPFLNPLPSPTTAVFIDHSVNVAFGEDGFRRWSDGSYACNCDEYRYPDKEAASYSGDTGSGIYKILPKGELNPLQVYCDMETDGGGWTLALLNSPYAVNPQPLWQEATTANTITGNIKNGLVNGFDQWLGLGFWNDLGNTLRMEIGSNPQTLTNQAYLSFYIDADTNYSIHLSNLKLTIGSTNPGLYDYHNHFPFTTIDKDNDTYNSNCAASYTNAPWWYQYCWSGSFWGGGQTSSAHLNAPFWTGSTSSDIYGAWGAFWIR